MFRRKVTHSENVDMLNYKPLPYVILLFGCLGPCDGSGGLRRKCMGETKAFRIPACYTPHPEWRVKWTPSLV